MVRVAVFVVVLPAIMVDLPAIMAVPAVASMVVRVVSAAGILDPTAVITAVTTAATTAAGDAAGAGGSAVLRLAMLQRLSWIVS